MTFWNRHMAVLLFVLFGLAVLVPGCNGDDDDDDSGDDDEGQPDDDDDTSVGDDDDDGGPYYDPSWAVTTDVLNSVRDFKIIRGIIHAHSIYSHDACDGEPVGNTECLMQLRQAVCDTRQDYFMLTDHDDMFAEHEFPDVLLHLPGYGDRLFYDEEERPVANRIFCPDGSFVTLMAGTENSVMPIHLRQHYGGTVQERYDLYGSRDPAAAEIFRDLGASVFINHDEMWSIEELLDYAPDGIEIFNLHAAIDPGIRPFLDVGAWSVILDLVSFLADSGGPHPNLVMMSFWPDTQAWNQRWDALLEVQRCVGIAATDVHRNSLPFALSDGERADGYRRMMQFFSNHILVQDEEFDTIEEAIDTGRLYVAFEYLGMPVDFDFHVTDGEDVFEMGDEAAYKSGLVAKVTMPYAFAIDPKGPQPLLAQRLIRVTDSGSTVVAEGFGDLEVTLPGPGAYRAEVYITPYHLEPFLGADPDRWIKSYPWVYANPVYILDE